MLVCAQKMYLIKFRLITLLGSDVEGVSVVVVILQ